MGILPVSTTTPTTLAPSGFDWQRRLGAGASAAVWKVAADGREFAVKVGHPHHADLLASEAERLILSGSPHLPRVHDAGLVEEAIVTPDGSLSTGSPYLLLDLVPGRTLGSYLSSDAAEPYEPTQLATSVLRDCGSALADLHSAAVAHGDVKPENIMVAPYPSAQPGSKHADGTKHPRPLAPNMACRMIDLGLAHSSSETLRGATPRYLPEDIGREAFAPARDLFALGLTVLEVLVPEARHDKHLSSNRWSHIANLPPHFRNVLKVLLGPAASRPSASWILGHVRSWGAPEARQPKNANEFEVGSDDEARVATIRRSYLATWLGPLQRVARGYQPIINVEGLPGRWLQEACQLLQCVARLRSANVGRQELFAPLSEVQRHRWLLRLLGSQGVDFPRLAHADELQLLERLLALPSDRSFRTLTLADLQSASADPVPSDPTELALMLGAEVPSPAVLARAEQLARSGKLPPRLVLRLSETLRKRHELGRALFALLPLRGSSAAAEPDRTSSEESKRYHLQRAMILTRSGELEEATEILESLKSCPGETGDASAAFLSRVALWRRDLPAAEQALERFEHESSLSFDALQARVSLLLSQGRLDDAQAFSEQAKALATSSEQHASIQALCANLAQQRGDAALAFDLFRSAAEHAARAGTVLEECTYLAGVAATATNLGQIGSALAASQRSALLFQYLNKPTEAARAWLARTSAFGAIGAKHEARSAAAETIELARQAGDRRCEGFVHLVLADISDEAEAREHVQRAETLLQSQPNRQQQPELRADDRLRLASRKLRLGDVPTKMQLELDRLAASQPSVEARLEWWGTRAEVAVGREPDQRRRKEQADQILPALLALIPAQGLIEARGYAFAHGAQLAAYAVDGQRARQLSLAASEAFRTLHDGTPPELRASVEQLPWAKLIRAPAPSDISPTQLADVEHLVAGLSDRTQLKTLLDRVLDALVLWTGVERGLLLLTAPGGQLVPRAGRHLARGDLNGPQLKLSKSLAERALSTGEFVVAVDAADELPELHESVHTLRLRSVLAVPLIARGEVLGVAYLDDRTRRGAFGERELSWVRLVATLAAVAIAEARDQLQLRRAVRKAQRAEARLAASLARREAQLAVAEQELAHTKNERGTRFSYREIVGNSEQVRQMLRLIDRVAAADIPVLIGGESGSGKELVARAIHRNSDRSEHPFVCENCSAIPESLLESTLFGHVKGAFTGAARQRAGLFEVAHQGTLFLDEIADMSLAMQAKLLRVLESGDVRRVGAERAIQVDVRVVAATHKDLSQLVSQGQFREDLLYRLNVIAVAVPPLRDRRSDIPLLVHHFLKKHGSSSDAAGKPITDEAMLILTNFDWPGNVRQLENETRRALVLADGTITADDLSPALFGSELRTHVGLNLKARVDSLEAELIHEALRQTTGNQTRAAQLLGISRFGLQKMIKRLGIRVKTHAGQARKAAVTGN